MKVNKSEEKLNFNFFPILKKFFSRIQNLIHKKLQDSKFDKIYFLKMFIQVRNSRLDV